MAREDTQRPGETRRDTRLPACLLPGRQLDAVPPKPSAPRFGEEPRVVAAGRLLPPWKQEKPRRGDSDATVWAGAEGPPSARGPRQREAPTCEEGPHLCALAFGFHAELDSEHFPEL